MKGIGLRGAGGGRRLGRPSPHTAGGAATSSGDPARLRHSTCPLLGFRKLLRPAAPPAVHGSGPRCGAAPSGGGSSQTPGPWLRQAARSPRWMVGLPPMEAGDAAFVGSVGFACGDAGFPGWPLESAEVLGRVPLWLHREKAPSPTAGVPSASCVPSSQKIRSSGIRPLGGIVKYRCLPKSYKQRETPLWCLRCLLYSGFQRGEKVPLKTV